MEVASQHVIRLATVVDQSQLNVPKQDLTSGSVEGVMKAVFGIAGGVALIVIVIGGLRYINSLGNAQNVAKAKDTILYAVIGLVVCILGYSIVAFVIQHTG